MKYNEVQKATPATNHNVLNDMGLVAHRCDISSLPLDEHGNRLEKDTSGNMPQVGGWALVRLQEKDKNGVIWC